MKVGLHHLSYCSNIHAGESWEDHFEQLKKHLPNIKQAVSPEARFGIGLRLSAKAALSLRKSEKLSQFKVWLESENCYVFTINGFPYGQFHHTAIKGLVHDPDWTSFERLEYTQNLAIILSELLPDGQYGTISTSPVSYKGWFRNSTLAQIAVLEQGSRHLAEMAHFLFQLKGKTGKHVELCIEPEPDGLLENTRSCLDFFQIHLWKTGVETLVENGIEFEQASIMLKNHIGICIDTCHFAVMFENPVEAFHHFESAGISVNKFQISAALSVKLDKQSIKDKLNALVILNEPIYLHQVCTKYLNQEIKLFSDIPEFFEKAEFDEIDEIRTHFHVPLFSTNLGDFQTTSFEAEITLAALHKLSFSKHVEVETYTWSILPDFLRIDIGESISKELKWAIEKLHL